MSFYCENCNYIAKTKQNPKFSRETSQPPLNSKSDLRSIVASNKRYLATLLRNLSIFSSVVLKETPALSRRHTFYTYR